MNIGIYAGSFDPITKGHIDIIERASKIVDKQIIAILINNNKVPLFTVDERIEMIKESIKHIPNIEIVYFSGLLVDLAKRENANIIIRGLRAVNDFEYELQHAQTNKELYPNIDTIFLTTSIQYSYVSSSVVKEVAMYGGDVSKFVSKNVEIKLREKYKVR